MPDKWVPDTDNPTQIVNPAAAQTAGVAEHAGYKVPYVNENAPANIRDRAYGPEPLTGNPLAFQKQSNIDLSWVPKPARMGPSPEVDLPKTAPQGMMPFYGHGVHSRPGAVLTAGVFGSAAQGLAGGLGAIRGQSPDSQGQVSQANQPVSAAGQTSQAPTVQNTPPAMSTAMAGSSSSVVAGHSGASPGQTSRTVTQPFIGPSGSMQIGMGPNYVGGQQNMGLYSVIVALQRMTDVIVNTVNRQGAGTGPVPESGRQAHWSQTF